jgi:hypothetical protein
VKLSDLVKLAKGKDPEILILQESDDGFDWMALVAEAELITGKIVVCEQAAMEVVLEGNGKAPFPKGLKKGKKS